MLKNEFIKMLNSIDKVELGKTYVLTRKGRDTILRSKEGSAIIVTDFIRRFSLLDRRQSVLTPHGVRNLKIAIHDTIEVLNTVNETQFLSAFRLVPTKLGMKIYIVNRADELQLISTINLVEKIDPLTRWLIKRFNK